ncbi:hypothetical protein [Micromonospora fluostatini]|uniref:hypothetical protein n=1 Tax=Micromonospora sp. JCM 30529 TaxID=3421643 RepID=UPI003D16B309
MSYRDWGRGEGSPREPIAGWADSDDPRPAASDASERYRTPSRRRAIERGQDEPVDTYLPRWALESGVERADGGGRHAAAPDDEPVRPRGGRRRAAEEPDGRRPTTGSVGGRRRAAEPALRDEPVSGVPTGSEHTREWTFDRPQQDGYVGSRRAESAGDDPVSGVTPRSRPRRATSRRPEVVWSGLTESGGGEPPTPTEDVAEPPRRSRRSRRATTESGSVPRSGSRTWPGSGIRSRSAESGRDGTGRRRAAGDPADQPPVDPWDVSGLHTWQRSGAGDDRVDSTGQWDRLTDTGQWNAADTGRWDLDDDTGQLARRAANRWARLPGPDGWAEADEFTVAPTSGTGSPVSGGWDDPLRPGGVDGGWSGADRGAREDRADRADPVRPRSVDRNRVGPAERGTGFWSGTRLSGDDPRWAEPPPSAPQSPVVGYPASRPATTPRRRAAAGETRAAAGRQAAAAAAPSWSRRIEEDLLDPDQSGPFRPLVYTVACYLVPALLVFLWLLTLDGQAPAGCVTDITGGGCASPRSQAFGSLVSGTPRFGLALASSLVVAELLRRVGTTWRPATIALAAAVMGGGLSTVMISVVTGQPIG